MSLLAAYRRFLEDPNSSNLTADASLYYITSTTTITGSTDIIKHFGTLRKQIKKSKETVLSTVEASAAGGLAIETETALEFISSGGPYLPALDDNFLADRKVSLALTHFVTFDAEGKITQIRQSWDQGSLLKQIDVIGKTGRNWPIRDGPEQIKLIARAVAADKNSAVPAAPAAGKVALPTRTRGNSALRDPHASLELFASREEVESQAASVVAPYAGSRPPQRDVTDILSDTPPEGDASSNTVVSPYGGRRPQQRSFEEILGDEDDDFNEEDPANGSPSNRGRSARARSRSPTKQMPPKAGSSKKFQPARLFEGDEAAAAALEEAAKNQDPSRSPERFYRPNPKRYDHFDFADGSEPGDAPKAGTAFEALPKSKHNSQWCFEDFTTPAKPPPRQLRGQDVRHFGIENDEFPETPSAARRKQPIARSRPDNEAHFEFQDDGVPSGEPRATRPRGAGQNEGMGLYKNNLYKEDGTAPTPAPARALGNITNLKDRQKMFDPHFAMADAESPSTVAAICKAATEVGNDRKKHVKMMEASWDDYEGQAKKENALPGLNVVAKAGDGRGIAIGGNGMGGSKGGRSWSFGGEGEDNIAPVPERKQHQGNQASDFWDF